MVSVEPLSDDEKLCQICGTQMVPNGTEVVRTELNYHKVQQVYGLCDW